MKRYSKVFVPVSVMEKAPPKRRINLDTFAKYYWTKEGFHWLEEKENVYVLTEDEFSKRLTFEQLRKANVARLPQFKNSKGELAHEKADGSDWSLAEWMNAVAGELGEAANIIKKVRRGDMTLNEARPLLAKEFADIVTYLDITAMQAGINLGFATKQKFNEVSNRVGSDIFL